MMFYEENKRQARRRHRKELAKQGIKIGCHHVESAKMKNGDQRQGKCMNCGMPAQKCACDDRSEWIKQRTG